MRYAAILILLLLPPQLAAQEPKPSVDTLVEQVVGIRAKRAELDKAESAALAALREQAVAALNANAIYLSLATPTAQQQRQQLERLTMQVSLVIRRLVKID